MNKEKRGDDMSTLEYAEEIVSEIRDEVPEWDTIADTVLAEEVNFRIKKAPYNVVKHIAVSYILHKLKSR